VGTGAQGAHQRGGRARGREFPAGLVAGRHALCGQLGADAARERAVGGGQRHRRTSLGQVAQHAGRGTLGFVFGIGCGMQGGDARGCIQRRERNVQHALAEQGR
jgi:hypothetical protein